MIKYEEMGPIALTPDIIETPVWDMPGDAFKLWLLIQFHQGKPFEASNAEVSECIHVRPGRVKAIVKACERHGLIRSTKVKDRGGCRILRAFRTGYVGGVHIEPPSQAPVHTTPSPATINPPIIPTPHPIGFAPPSHSADNEDD